MKTTEINTETSEEGNENFQKLLKNAKLNQNKIFLGGTISLCCIVKDEMDNMAEFLECWGSYVDEICLVDTGSRDSTLDFAIRYCDKNKIKLKTELFEWCDDFAKARNVSLEMAECEWVMYADADDRIKPEVGNIIRRVVIEQSQLQGGILFSVQSQVLDKQVDDVSQLRLFKRSLGLRFSGAVHEVLSTEEKVKSFYMPNIIINHIGYTDAETLKAKHARNNRIIDANQDDPNLMYYKGKVLYNNKDYWKALGLFLVIISKDDIQDQFKDQLGYLIGRIFMHLESLPIAISWLTESKEVDAYYYLACCYDAQGKPMASKDSYSKYIQIAETSIAYFGTMKSRLMPVALERVRKITANEVEYWNNYQLQ